MLINKVVAISHITRRKMGNKMRKLDKKFSKILNKRAPNLQMMNHVINMDAQALFKTLKQLKER